MNIKKFIVISAVSLCSASAASAKADEILIGDIFSIGGPVAMFSTPYVAAIDHAVNEINEKGGVLGKKLKIIRKNDKTAASLSGTLAEELILKDKVHFLIGGLDTGNCAAIADVAKKHKKVFFMTGCIAPKLTAELFNPYVARATVTTEMAVRATARLVAKKYPNINKWATIGTNNEFGKVVWADFKSELKKANPKFSVVGEYWPLTSETDFSPYIATLMASGAQGIMNGLWGAMSVSFLKQSAPYGVFKKTKYATMTGMSHEELHALGKDAIIGGFGPGLPWKSKSFEKENPDYSDWHKKFVAKTGLEPGSITDFAVRSIYGLVEAIRLAGSTKSEDVVKVLDKGYKFKSPWVETEMRGCDHQGVVHVPVGHIIKGTDGRPQFEALESYDGKELIPSCQEIKKLRASK